MGREGAKGEGISLLRCASASSQSGWRRYGFSFHTLSQFLSPISAHPPSRACRKGAAAGTPARALGEAVAVGVCVCEGHHLSLRRLQAAAGSGASRSGSSGDSGSGFRSPAAKMLKVTVPSCSASSCSSVTASVAPAAGSLVPDYWIDGSNRDALSDFFEVESELGR